MNWRYPSFSISIAAILILLSAGLATAEITGVWPGIGLDGGGDRGDVTLGVEVPLQLDHGGMGGPTITGSHSGDNAGLYGRNTSTDTSGYLGHQDFGARGEHRSGNFGYLGGADEGVAGVHSSGTRGELGVASCGVVAWHPNERVGCIGGRDHAVYGRNATTPTRWGHLASDDYGVYGRAQSRPTGGVAGHFESEGMGAIGLEAEADGTDARGGDFSVTGWGAHAVHATSVHYSQFAGFFEGRVRVDVLQVVGSDLSERFHVGSADGTVSPGMVVSIDPDNPGDLVLSTDSYDRRVAGIVSGAGNVSPGVLMGEGGTAAEADLPIALSGRVYCWADATNGAIAPGDLLTTSSTPGHAMKANDPRMSQGATLGKAMTALDEGRGLVLVLVALQ